VERLPTGGPNDVSVEGKPGRETPAACPSAQPHMEGAIAIGLVDHTGDNALPTSTGR
jgi:hypothetical protein